MKTFVFCLITIVSLMGMSQTINSISKHAIVYNPAIAELISRVDTNRILYDIEQLSSISSRCANVLGNDTAADFIMNRMQQFNLNVIQQPLNSLPDTLMPKVNVIGIKTGALYPDSFIVVGAHFDSYCDDICSPGADDNASGVAGMLELIRLMNEIETEYSILFCGFNAEELGMIGSMEFVDSALNNGMALIFNLNIDMIGYSMPIDSMYIVLCTHPTYDSLAQAYSEISELYVPFLPILGVSHLYYFSDHYSFIDNNIAALSLFENYFDSNPFVHTFADTIGAGFNSPRKAQLVTQVNLAFLCEFAGIYGFSSVEDVKTKLIKVYPNPVGEIVNIEGVETGTPWLVSDLGGRLLMNGLLERNVVNLQSLSPGAYIFNIGEYKQIILKQ